MAIFCKWPHHFTIAQKITGFAPSLQPVYNRCMAKVYITSQAFLKAKLVILIIMAMIVFVHLEKAQTWRNIRQYGLLLDYC